MTDFVLMLIAGSLVVGAGDWFIRQVILYRRRFNGRTWDPNRPVVQRAGATRVGMTGTLCHFCDVVTYGYAGRCGKCHRLPVRLPPMSLPSPFASEASISPSLSPVTNPRHDQAATAHHVNLTSLSPAPAPAPASRGTRRRRGGSAS